MLSKLFALAIVAAMIAGVTVAQAVQPQTNAANAAVQYIESLQNMDGGFPSFGSDSSPGATLDVAFALAAAGEDAADVSLPGGTTMGEYLSAQVAPPDDPGALAKLSFGLSAIGLDGGALVDDMRQHVTHDGYGDDVFDEAFYVFALAAADEPRPVSAAYLRSIQQPDGGWEFADTFGSDSNTTAMALQALLASGGSPAEQATRDALAYLTTTQNDDGGFGFTETDDSDANSTALVIQALVAADEDIDVAGPWERHRNTPLDGLLSFRNAATGAFQYAGEDSPFATYQAVPALMLAPFPDLQTRVEVEPTPVATAITTFVPTATAQPVLPSAGSPPGPSEREQLWPIAALLSVGLALSFAALRWRIR
jgi:hypothetical protein